MPILPDEFGATPQNPIVPDPLDGVRYTLGFDHSTIPPTPVWVPVTSWALAKQRWATWREAKASAPGTWGLAKTTVALGLPNAPGGVG